MLKAGVYLKTFKQFLRELLFREEDELQPKRYELKFKKTYKPVNLYRWQEVSDSEIIVVLHNLQNKYQFDIEKIAINDCFKNSCIEIKCLKKDREKIFAEFCSELGGHITEVSY